MNPVKDSDWKEHNIYNGRNGGSEEEDGDNDNAEAAFHLFDRDDEAEPEIFNFDFDGCLSPPVQVKGYDACTTSTGLGVWSGAEALCHFLVQHPHYVEGKRVLELGAGTGLVGLVAKALGASSVVMTDGDVCALSNLRHNAHTLNPHLRSNDKNNQDNNDTLECRQLIWGQGLDDFVDQTKGNDNGNDGGGRFDVILAADCLYMRPSVDPFWKTVNRLLGLGDDSVVLYTNPSASQAPLETVLEAARQHGLEQQEAETQLVIKGSQAANEDDVVYVFRRRKR